MDARNIYCPVGKNIINASVVVGALVFLIQSQRSVWAVPTEQNSTMIMGGDSAVGMYYWSFDGQSQLGNPWISYRIGSSGVAQPINMINPASLATSEANEFEVTSDHARLSLTINYGLPSEAVGATPSLGEAVFYPVANGAETDHAFNTLTKLTGSSRYNLNNSLSSGPGNVTWALQWDANLAAGGDLFVSKDKKLQFQAIPEPSTLALLALGLTALGFGICRRIP